MKKFLILSEDDNAMTITNRGGTLTSAIQYIDVLQCTKVVLSDETKERLPNMSDYVLLKLSSGKEIKLNLAEILSPDFLDIDEMYSEIYTWIYGSTPPTPTTPPPPGPDYSYPLYLVQADPVQGAVWVRAPGDADVSAILNTAASYEIVGTDFNDKIFTLADLSGVNPWSQGVYAPYTVAPAIPTLVNQDEYPVSGVLNVYMD